MFALSRATFALALLLLGPMLHADSDRVTMSFEGVPLSEAVNELIAQTDLSFGVPPELQNRLGLGVRIREIPVSAALEIFAVAYQVCFFQSTHFVHIIETCINT
jgi:hypothetical protein